MPDARIDNLAVARKVRFRYTGGAYGCASGRGMGLSLEHDGRRRGYALSLTAGLLWGVGLVKLALSMSFSTVSFQLDGYSSLGMLVGFGGSLALFVPLSVQKPELFSKPSAVIAFGALFIAGELLFLLPSLAPVLQWAQVTLSSTLHAVANVFFLCGLASRFISLDSKTLASCLFSAALVASAVLAVASYLPVPALQVFFLAASTAAVVFYGLLLRTEPPARGAVDAASSIASGNVLCGVYGLALGLSFNRGAYGQEHGPLLLLCCIVLVEAALGLLRMRKGGKAQLLGPVQVVVVVLGLAALLPLGLPLQGLADALSIVAWLLFWAALSSGMLGFSEHRPLTSVALFAVAFVAGRLAADFGFGPLLASVGQIGGIVGLTASIVAIAAPCYLLAERFSGRKVTSADRDDPEMAYAPTFDGRFDALARQHGLTPREREVLELIARGRNRQYVAEKLVISEGTAKTHIKRIYAKLGIHSREELLDLVQGRS